MKVEVYPSVLKGVLSAPGSKSVSQRLAAAALLSNGETRISKFPESADCAAAIQIIQSLGAVVTKQKNETIIRGGFPFNNASGIKVPKSEFNCGESGLSSRMFTPIAALHNDKILVKGEGSLLSRPFTEFDTVLPALGASCKTSKGLLPLQVLGPLKGGKAVIDGSISSQFLTGLLMALPVAEYDSTLKVKELKSIPYVQMTLEVLAKFGINITHDNFETFEIKGKQVYKPSSSAVPGDWSGAAFLLVAAAIASEEGLEVSDLNREITQADNKIIDVLRLAGVEHTVYSNSVFVKKSEIQSFEFDASDCPDLVPPIVALAAYGNGLSMIKGAKRLVHKESNRAKALQDEFAKANIRIVIRQDELLVYPSPIRPAVINSHNDHRIAMAAALLALEGDKIVIQGAECINKSYPDFFKDLLKAGAKLIVR